MNQIYIFEEEKQKLILTNELPEAIPLLAAHLKEQINGEVSLSFSIPSKHPDSDQIKRGNWAILKDLDGLFRAFVIVEEEETHDENGLIRKFYTEELAVNELNDEVVIDIRPETTAMDALNKVLQNTRWQTGTVGSFGTNRTNVYYRNHILRARIYILHWRAVYFMFPLKNVEMAVATVR